MKRPPSVPKPGFFSTQVAKARVFYRDVSTLTLKGADAAFAVHCGGCEHCAPDYRIERETFPDCCLEFVVGGAGSLGFGSPEERRQPLGPGAVFSFGPGVYHRIESDPARPLVKYFVGVVGPDARRRLKAYGLAPGTLSQIAPAAALAVRELFEQLLDAGLSASPHAPRLAALLLEAVLLRCAADRVPPPGAGGAETAAFVTYRRCREAIDAARPLFRTTREAARACHVDEAYLCRLFGRFAGVSPLRHLTRLRINAATQRLIEPGRLVKEVAEEFGFADPYHFSRTFKRTCGVSPREFLQARRR